MIILRLSKEQANYVFHAVADAAMLERERGDHEGAEFAAQLEDLILDQIQGVKKCWKGHPLTDANTWSTVNGSGCRQCRRDAQDRHKERQKAKRVMI